jgi:hypothetical protein
MKGQVEIMGLAMIIILLSLGMLFVVKFVVTRETSTVGKDYTQNKVAANLMNAMLKSSTDCLGTGVREPSMTELMQDCMTSNQIMCNKTTSRQKLEESLSLIFNSTLHQWRKNYQFNITNTLNPTKISMQDLNFSANCAENKETELYPIPLHPGTMFVRLDICG